MFLCVSVLKPSWMGIAKTMRSRTAVLVAWPTKTRMNDRGSREL